MVTVPVLEEPFFGISFWLMRLEWYWGEWIYVWCFWMWGADLRSSKLSIYGILRGHRVYVFTGVQRQPTGLLCSEGASISRRGPVHTKGAVLVYLTQILTTDTVDLVAEECLVLKTPILWDNWLAGDINMSYGRGTLFKLSERWPMIWRWSWAKEAITTDLWNILLQSSGRRLAQLGSCLQILDT